MARYIFQADYRDTVVTDEIGEEFATREEAEAHAAIIASELGRNETSPSPSPSLRKMER
jgi:hypothetical protein